MGPPPFYGVLISIPLDPIETLVLRQEWEMVAKDALTRVPDNLAHKGCRPSEGMLLIHMPPVWLLPLPDHLVTVR